VARSGSSDAGRGERGFLGGSVGQHKIVNNTLPPIPFGDSDADLLLERLDELLHEDVLRYVGAAR